MIRTDLTIRLATSLDGISAEDWNSCAQSGRHYNRLPVEYEVLDEAKHACCGERNMVNEVSATSLGEPSSLAHLEDENDPYNPFVDHRFLSALEQSGSVGKRTGWAPAYLVVERGSDLLAVAPSFLKTHSRGEYVFDYGWADAFERAGGSYYPKLQVSVPFTPVTGRRLLVREDADVGVRGALVAALAAASQQVESSSVHVTFPTHGEWEALGHAGYLQRTGQQFHWTNDGYATFEDFLAALASRKRKAIRRERSEAVANGIEIVPLTGSDLREEHWDAFFRFYMDTGSRKWGQPYLKRSFFSLIGASMPERIFLVMARRSGQWIAGALNLIGNHALYGRNWGAVEHHPFLHFELCYYQAIDFAIRRGLRRVEAGAQGEHKLARGYRPVSTYSAHLFHDARMQRAVAEFLAHERQHVDATIAMYEEHVPFRKDG